MDLVPQALPWLLALIGLVLFGVTLEGVVRSFVLRLPYDWRGYAASIADFGRRRAVDALGLSLATPLLVWAYENRLQTIALSGPAAFFLLFIGQEFCYYALFADLEQYRGQ